VGQTAYLFGTMHIRDERVYRFCDAVYPLILDSDVYVGEMDLNPMDGLSLGPTYNMQVFFRPGVYSKLRKQLLKSFSLDIDRYTHLHPLMIMSAISQTILSRDHAVSLDEHLWNFARENHKVLHGLETVQEQVNLLHSIAPEPLYTQIRNISSRPEMIRKFTDKVLTSYTSGDIHHLYRLTKASMHGLRKRIIFDRNRLMAQRITEFDLTRRYFIAVGAGHLSGSTGIISGLRKSGYKVRPVEFPPLKGESESARHT
jgi:uncharacterized protein YbaP (TraB family)